MIKMSETFRTLHSNLKCFFWNVSFEMFLLKSVIIYSVFNHLSFTITCVLLFIYSDLPKRIFKYSLLHDMNFEVVRTKFVYCWIVVKRWAIISIMIPLLINRFIIVCIHVQAICRPFLTKSILIGCKLKITNYEELETENQQTR